eukprot:TRINITY_DN61740_c0_g1_i1.p1 TRINITY_DN61740_c0_g1~~TRINITY_DN61740_c0_g1_i1.p1  ORF type:complete len:663 (-),score=116.41 TRINITY_DN61740_c0_g1_i1:113-2062(-)
MAANARPSVVSEILEESGSDAEMKTDEKHEKGQGDPPSQQKPTALVDSNKFCVASCTVVVCNLICLGIQTDARGDEFEVLFELLNSAFLLIYLAELMLRFLTHGSNTWKDSMTIMDIFLVVIIFFERVLSKYALSASLPSLRLARVTRLFRLVSVVKLGKELRVLLHASKSIMKTIIWLSALVVLILFVCAFFAHEVIGESAQWNTMTDPSRFTFAFADYDNNRYFGSIATSFITLMQVVTLSQWADNVARPVILVYPMSFAFFAFLVLLVSYGTMIGVVANMVQDSVMSDRNTQAALMEQRRDKRAEVSFKIVTLIAQVDANNDGELSAEEIDLALETHPQVGNLLKELQVPFLDGTSLVQMLDQSGDGLISYEEFQNGIVAMEEDIQQRDWVKLNMRVENLLNRTEYLKVRMQKLHTDLHEVHDSVAHAFQAVRDWIDTREDLGFEREARKMVMNMKVTVPIPKELKKPKPKPVLQHIPTFFLDYAERFLGDVIAGPSKKTQAAYMAAHNGIPLRSGRPLRGNSADADEMEAAPVSRPSLPGAVPEGSESVAETCFAGSGDKLLGSSHPRRVAFEEPISKDVENRLIRGRELKKIAAAAEAERNRPKELLPFPSSKPEGNEETDGKATAPIDPRRKARYRWINETMM